MRWTSFLGFARDDALHFFARPRGAALRQIQVRQHQPQINAAAGRLHGLAHEINGLAGFPARL